MKTLVALKSINQSCTATSECLSTLGLSCVSSICTCSSIYYWNGITCTPQQSLFAACSATYQCSTASSLNCINGICNCLNSTYWSGTSCGLHTII